MHYDKQYMITYASSTPVLPWDKWGHSTILSISGCSNLSVVRYNKCLSTPPIFMLPRCKTKKTGKHVRMMASRQFQSSSEFRIWVTIEKNMLSTKTLSLVVAFRAVLRYKLLETGEHHSILHSEGFNKLMWCDTHCWGILHAFRRLPSTHVLLTQRCYKAAWKIGKEICQSLPHQKQLGRLLLTTFVTLQYSLNAGRRTHMPTINRGSSPQNANFSNTW